MNNLFAKIPFLQTTLQEVLKPPIFYNIRSCIIGCTIGIGISLPQTYHYYKNNKIDNSMLCLISGQVMGSMVGATWPITLPLTPLAYMYYHKSLKTMCHTPIKVI
jgi:hypothetical protein